MNTSSAPANPLHKLGSSGLKLPAVGFGLMGMSQGVYGPVNDDHSQAVLQEVAESGCVFWDTADVYGSGHNETLIAPILKQHRDKIFICTKFALHFTAQGISVSGDREYVHQACEDSLKRLGVEYIDLYYQHRVDPKVPIEETVKAMRELQDAGKIKYIGLSECTPDELERACKIARIDALQIEFSPWETTIETNGMLDIMRKHGVSLVAYSPLGRGMLTGSIKSVEDLDPADFRRSDPRYQGENFKLNMELVERIKSLAEAKSKAIGEPVTPAAFCLAWVLYQGDDVFVIPGTTKSDRFKENLSAGRVFEKFTKDDDRAVREIIAEINVSGARYSPEMMKAMNMK